MLFVLATIRETRPGKTIQPVLDIEVSTQAVDAPRCLPEDWHVVGYHIPRFTPVVGPTERQATSREDLVVAIGNKELTPGSMTRPE